MDASDPGALCGSVIDEIFARLGCSWGSEGAKRGPKNENIHILAVLTPQTARERPSSKHNSYLRYREVLWRQNRDFKFFRFGSRHGVPWADMGPPTGNRWAPGATSQPLFPSYMTLQ